MRFEPHEIEQFGLKFGDNVMCEGGELGRCAIWKEQIAGMMLQKSVPIQTKRVRMPAICITVVHLPAQLWCRASL